MAYLSDATASEAARDPRAQCIIKRLHSLGEAANQVRTSAGQTADKIMGPTPVEVGKSEPELKLSGFFGEIETIIASIERTLALASDHLRRFEREF